jgi:hypothetical protein
LEEVFFSSFLVRVLDRFSICWRAAVALRVGYPQPSGALLPLWLVSEARLDQKYGAPVQNIFLSGAARINQSMIAGDIDLASVGGAVVHTVLAGGDLVAIAGRSDLRLHGRAEVKTSKSRGHHEQGVVVGARGHRFAASSQPATGQGC